MTTDLAILAPLINPWNGVVALATLLIIEVIKSAFPSLFINGHGGNRWLRPLCVLGCGIGYQIDGPWITGDMDFWLRLFVGGLVGAATTVGYALARGLVKVALKKHPSPKNLGTAIKDWGKVLGILAGIFSGLYGAWFRPETKAKESYELLAKAVEDLSKDVDELAKADTAMDKDMAVKLARLDQRLDDMQELLKDKLEYKPAPVKAPVVVTEPVAVVGDTELMVANDAMPAPKPEIKRQGLKIQMPSAQEVGF